MGRHKKKIPKLALDAPIFPTTSPKTNIGDKCWVGPQGLAEIVTI